jgi:DNA-binding transcriptional ArsR family regulator
MYVRELARRCDVALSAVQEELANLVDADLLRRRSDGFHVFYRANRKHAMFVDLQQPGDQKRAHQGCTQKTNEAPTLATALPPF